MCFILLIEYYIALVKSHNTNIRDHRRNKFLQTFLLKGCQNKKQKTKKQSDNIYNKEDVDGKGSFILILPISTILPNSTTQKNEKSGNSKRVFMNDSAELRKLPIVVCIYQ